MGTMAQYGDTRLVCIHVSITYMVWVCYLPCMYPRMLPPLRLTTCLGALSRVTINHPLQEGQVVQLTTLT